MKFVLFLIKTLSVLLCLGLLGAYFYYAFFAETKSQFMADASLLLFVLSAVVTALTIVLSENKVKSAPATGLDAYLAELRKEEKNTAKQIQNALPKDLLPMLEKAVAAIGENKEAMNTTLLDSKTAFSSALSENKNALSSLLTENQSSLMASVAESMRILDTRLTDNNNSFGATLNNLLEQVTALANKNTAPINMALENINARLDELENKIVSNRVGSLAQDKTFETPQDTPVYDFQTPYTETANTPENTYETSNDLNTDPMTADTSGYDFNAWNNTPAEDTQTAEPAADAYDFTTPAADSVNDIATEDAVSNVSEAEPVADTSGYDFSAWDNTPAEDIQTAEPVADAYDFTTPAAENAVADTETPASDEPFAYDYGATQQTKADMDESVSGYADGLAPNTETDQRNAFDDDLSALADLEIMQEPVAPTAEPQFDEIDIDEFLKGRTDVKN